MTSLAQDTAGPMMAPVAECSVCPRSCRLPEDTRGMCGVRMARGGSVRPIAQQAFVASGVQRLRQHPLLEFIPDARTLCLGTLGCNASCHFCQNWELAITPQSTAPSTSNHEQTSPEKWIDLAVELSCGAVSFTYAEAALWPEGVLPVAKLARNAGLRVVMITNAYLSHKTLSQLLPWLDAVKVDLKGPNDAISMGCAGLPVSAQVRAAARLRAAGVWVELSSVISPMTWRNGEDWACFSPLLSEFGLQDAPFHLMQFVPAHHWVKVRPVASEALRAHALLAQNSGLHRVAIYNGFESTYV